MTKLDQLRLGLTGKEGNVPQINFMLSAFARYGATGAWLQPSLKLRRQAANGGARFGMRIPQLGHRERVFWSAAKPEFWEGYMRE